MKKIISLLLILILISCITGCSVENNKSQNSSETTTVDLIESSNCIVLCKGKDKEENNYSLVGKQEETFDSVIIKVGVIKNNEWLVPLSSDFPFISDGKDTFIGGEIIYANNKHPIRKSDGGWVSPNEFKYVANGCFSYGSNVEQRFIIYNFETNKYYDFGNKNNFDNKTYRFSVYCVDDESSTSNIVVFSRNLDSGGYSKQFSILNTDTMEENIIVEKTNDCIMGPYADGLFAVGENYHGSIFYFFDSNGNQVLDVTKYGLCNNYDSTYFKNNVFCFTKTNSAGTKYNLTINIKGEIISNEVAE